MLIIKKHEMEAQKSQTKTVRLDESVVRKVEEMAKNENRNFSNMVETILMKATRQEI